MIISSRPEAMGPGALARAFTNVATLGAAAEIQKRAPAEADEQRRQRLEDLRLPEPLRELLDDAFRAACDGRVEHVEIASRVVKGQKVQWTVAGAPGREWILLDIPASILGDGSQVRRLYELYFLLKGKTVRVFSRDLDGVPASAFNGLKQLWEEEDDQRTSIDFVPASYVDELRQGSGDLENVLRISLAAPAAAPRPAAPGAVNDTPAPGTTPLRSLDIFLASSAELRSDRDAFDLYFRQQNDKLVRRGLRLQIHRWENFLDAISETRMQDEYNVAVRDADVVVCLFFTKTGNFTEEEFDTAHRQFLATGRPRIYTYFKRAPISPDTPRKDLESLWAFQDKLRQLEHFYTQYASTEDLQLKFRDQLDRLLDG